MSPSVTANVVNNRKRKKKKREKDNSNLLWHLFLTVKLNSISPTRQTADIKFQFMKIFAINTQSWISAANQCINIQRISWIKRGWHESYVWIFFLYEFRSRRSAAKTCGNMNKRFGKNTTSKRSTMMAIQKISFRSYIRKSSAIMLDLA